MIVTDLPLEGCDLTAVLAELEHRLIAQALSRSQGSKNAAAKLLGLKRTTFVMKMRRHGFPLNPPVKHLARRLEGAA